MGAEAPPVVLRDYQVAAIGAVRAAYRAGHRNVILQAPTGAGKTVIFTHVAKGVAETGRRVLVLVHRRELLHQVCSALARWGVGHGVIAPGRPEDAAAPVQVAMVLTLASRLKRHGARPYQADWVVVDECHHAVQGTAWGAVLAAQAEARVLGVTATPCRLDGRGLGREASGFFDVLIEGPTYAELIAAGHLARPRVWRGRRPDLRGVRAQRGDWQIDDLAERMQGGGYTGDAIAEYVRRCPGQAALVFCVNVAHAEAVAADFRAAGYAAAGLHGDTPLRVRERLLHDLAAGDLKVIASCNVVSEGTDIPMVTAAILLRPTKSLCLAWQQIGRALRPWPGKDYAVILDHAGNIARLGFPTDPVVWSLCDKVKQAAVEWKTCPVCQMESPVGTRACEACGYVWLIEEAVGGGVAEIPVGTDDVLEEMLLDAAGRRVVIDHPSQARCRADLEVLAVRRGYKPGWVYYAWREQKKRLVAEHKDGRHGS